MNTPVWGVKKIQPQNNYFLVITFADGTRRIYDARPLLDKAIYAPLRNLTFFLNAKVDCGTVVWNDNIDIAPEHLYEYFQPVGGAFSDR